MSAVDKAMGSKFSRMRNPSRFSSDTCIPGANPLPSLGSPFWLLQNNLPSLPEHARGRSEEGRKGSLDFSETVRTKKKLQKNEKYLR
jgi:hypothetical protein